MRGAWVATWLTCALTTLAGMQHVGLPAAAQDMHDALSPAAGVRVVTAAATGLLLEVTTPLPRLEARLHHGAQATIITLPGAITDAQPDALPLPMLGVLAALPPGHTATMRVIEDERTVMSLPAPLWRNAPLAHLDAATAAADGGAGHPLDDRPRNTAPMVSKPFLGAAVDATQTPAQIEGIERWRSQSVARLRFRPVELTEQGAELIVHRRLLVALDFVSNDFSPLAAETTLNTHIDEGAFETVMAAALVNYAQARAWRYKEISSTTMTVANPQHDRRWRVEAPESGMVRIDCTALAAAGAAVTDAPPARWRVQRDGKYGPTLATSALNDNGDDRCDAGEYLIFYADVQPTRYAAGASFWLSITSEPGPRIQVESPAPAAMPQESYLHRDRYENNRLYYSYIPLQDGAEHWYWDILTPATSTTRSYPFTVTEIVNIGDAHLVFDLAGYDGAHATQITVNEQSAGLYAWSGRIAHTIEVNVPATWLHNGANMVRVAALGAAPDLQYVDAFAVNYARRLVAQHDQLRFTAPRGHHMEIEGFSTPDVAIYALGNPGSPRRVAVSVTQPCPCRARFDALADDNTTYLAITTARYISPTLLTAAPAADLVAPAAGADLLILTPADLAPALAPLVAHRRASGLRVRVVDIQSIYDEFGDGRTDPEAIQHFLNHTLRAWPSPAPAYVLLVGDGTYDPRGYLSTPPTGAVPAFLRLVDPVIGETASDNRYVTATPASQLPQMMIGRLPARTAAEATTMIAKILVFEAALPSATWRQRAIIVADNAYQSDGSADAAGNFWAMGDRAANRLESAGVTVDRFYYNPCAATTASVCALPDPPYPRYADAPALTAAFQTAVHAGRGLAIYTGHASPLSWAGAPALLHTNDVRVLDSGDRPFVALEMTCYTGFFHGPRDALAETLLRAEGGAVASWASSGQSMVRGQDVLLEQLLATFLADTKEAVTLGQAILAAKLHLYGTGAGIYGEALDTFHLFGDPSLLMREAAPPPTPTPASTALTPSAPPTTATPMLTMPAPTATSITVSPSTPTPAIPPPLFDTPLLSPTSAPISDKHGRIFLPIVQQTDPLTPATAQESE